MKSIKNIVTAGEFEKESPANIDKWIKKNSKGSFKLLYLKCGHIKLTRGHIILSTNETHFPDYIRFATVRGDISIENCPNLTNIRGLFCQELPIEGSLDISNCPKLESLEGLSFLIAKNLTLVSCPSLKVSGNTPIHVMGNTYVNKCGRRWTGDNFTGKDPQITESLVLNEELNEPHLLKLANQLRKDKSWSPYYKIFNDNDMEWKEILPSAVREYTDVDDERFRGIRRVISLKNLGCVLLGDGEKYTHIINGLKNVLNLQDNTCGDMSYTNILALASKSNDVTCIDFTKTPKLGRKFSKIITKDEK